MMTRAVVYACLLVHALGCVAQSAGTDGRRAAAVRAEVEALLVQWAERDGELRFLISDRLAMSLIANPSEFMAVTGEHPAVFGDWVEHVGGASLRDHGDPLINRQILLEEMLKAVQRAVPTTASAGKAREMLLTKLQQTAVTAVD